MMPSTITLTGVDERTSMVDLVELCHEFNSVEIGILYSASPEKRTRYPSWFWIRTIVPLLGLRCAVHICGSGARAHLAGGSLSLLCQTAGRIQINGVVKNQELGCIARASRAPLITQHTDRNAGLLRLPVKRHQILLDDSGGRGELRRDWRRPVTSKPVGFAGGLGPDNLREQLANISEHAQDGDWVDMETGLRTCDWFDIDKARECAAIFEAARAA